MTVYAVADGHNVADDDLVTIDPQPRIPDKLDYAELMFPGNGMAYVNGFLQTVLVWSSLTREQYADVLDAFDLSDTVRSNAVTVRVRNNLDVFTRYNATAILLQAHKRSSPIGIFWDNVQIQLNEMESL